VQQNVEFQISYVMSGIHVMSDIDISKNAPQLA